MSSMLPPAKADRILCINGGSSSLKVAVFDMAGGRESSLARVSIGAIGKKEGHSKVRLGDGEEIADDAPCPTPAAALDHALALLVKHEVEGFEGIAHRIVHGGPHLGAPVVIDDAVLARLAEATPLAPLHMPGALAAIDAMKRRFPALPQVACFDTGFHATLPEVAYRLPLPARFTDQGVRRYGFHGISYEYVMGVLAEEGPVPSRLVIAHLGSGSSLVAVKDGVAIDTTMGMTPTGGVMMGTRTGDLDPGVLLYLLREAHLTVDELEEVVERQAGLMAIAGTSDVESLVARREEHPDAALALAMFAMSVRKAIGALAATLGGLDVLVFTGGIGEHAAELRAEIGRGVAHLGAAERVIATDEDVVLARHARRLLERCLGR
ncbi:MAG: Acetate kinase [Labilithrix sp.]|nr:Acetate kinase [Labilithrix sp.]